MSEKMIDTLDYLKRSLSKLEARRKEAGLSLRALSEKCSISAATLSRMERDIGTADFNTICKICKWMSRES